MGKAKTMVKAHNNIKTLMANLDVTTAPVQVLDEKGNLIEFQHEAQDGMLNSHLFLIKNQYQASNYLYFYYVKFRAQA